MSTKKKLRYVHGIAARSDELRAGAIISDTLSENDGFELRVDKKSKTPLESLQKHIEKGSSEIDVYSLCVESSKTRAGNALNVKVFDYLKDGECVVDMNYPVTHEAFLKGCTNLARKLQVYLQENEPKYKEMLLGNNL